jgi:uncharacterized protein DUF6519/parallel beta helix pectate lyase-like protein
MKGDFSRNTFDPLKHFVGVRMQQGRVQVDADWNENLDILLHRIETETMDVIGLCGFPIHAAGFGVVADPKTLSAEEQQALQDAGYLPLEDGDFLLTAGRGYLDGILAELEHTIPFSLQPCLLPPVSDEFFPSDGTFLIYLDVWERLITALEDPSIREVALGGPDTAVRSQVIWQVKSIYAGEEDDNLDCDAEVADYPPATSDGLLCARTHPEPQPDDPCTVPPGAGYKRLENQLYRVEIHRGTADPDGPTFKWSRDNGSIVVKVSEFAVDGANDKVRVTSLGRDDVLGLHELDWVEVLDDAADLSGLPGQLVQIDKIDRERLIITLKDDVTGFDLDLHPKFRRWDSAGELTVEVPADNDGFIPLEDGVEVKFEINTFNTGDYWTIPARTVPGQYGDIEWPEDENDDPACLPPFGIKHHYCRLAMVVVTGGVITQVTDCRDKFPPLTELPSGGSSCCSVTVGEGGDYPDIQSAVNARPADAKFWNICLLSGEYKLQDPVKVDGQDGIGLAGCSDQTLVSGVPGQPLFQISNSSAVRIEGLQLRASVPEGAIQAFKCFDISVKGCRGENVDEKTGKAAGGPLVFALNCGDLVVQGNTFRGQPAIVVQGQTILVNDNFLSGGGVQVLFGSQVVAIEDNLIFEGAGPGIQLSGFSTLAKEFAGAKTGLNQLKGESGLSPKSHGYEAWGAVRETRLVTIKHNLIGSMQGSGILTLTNMTEAEEMGEVTFLTISDNTIARCADKPDLKVTDTRQVGGGINLSSVSDVTISDNLVAFNGRRLPACGIVVINGANVEIIDNVLTENGTDEEESNAGYQAGIAALFVLGDDVTLTDAFGGEKPKVRRGVPALRVRGNQVVAPAGLALNALTFGTTAVTDNNFVSRGRREQPVLLAGANEFAAGVQVRNMGYQSWLAGLIGAMQSANFHLDPGTAMTLTDAQKSLPDGRILFNDNQVTLSYPAVEGRDARLVFSAVALLSLDDISCQGNQFQSDVTPDHLGTDVFTYGVSVRATGNNFSEPAGSAYLSYLSQGIFMNATTSNQAVHCILTGGAQKVETDNLVMLAALCQQFAQIKSEAIYVRGA